MPSSSPQHALELLRSMLDSHADFRPGQWDAIEAVAIKKKHALVVQRTGWGKSLVYFIAMKLLREQGAGATLLISPLLSLMRNQIEMAARIGIRAHTIHSANREEWDNVEAALKENACDVLLISPERLNNERFLQSILPGMAGRIGLFVVGDLCLVTPYNPNVGFSVGAAMGRNRLIYCLADYAIVVASDAETGGTWAGATETLKNNWIPVFALEHENMSEGNKLLLQKGALSFPHPFKETPVTLPSWMKEKAASIPQKPNQPSLF